LNVSRLLNSKMYKELCKKEIVTLSELKNSLVGHTFQCFHNGKTVETFFFLFLQHAVDWTASTVQVFSVNELFMN